MAIAVVIHPSAARTVSRGALRQACFLGSVRKRTIAVIAVENIVSVVGDEQIVVTVVVIVADRNCRRPAGAHESSFRGYVSECAVAIVLVQAIGSIRRRTAEPRAAEDEQVHPAVIIVVDEGDA